MLHTVIILHAMAIVTPILVHWLERENVQWVYQDRLHQDPPHEGRAFYHRVSPAPWTFTEMKYSSLIFTN